MLDALDQTTLGGATDLGAMLELAVSAVSPSDSNALFVYVGDGWGTLGDEDLSALGARMARRTEWTPRLGAVMVGGSPNRVLLSALTRGKGPLFEMTDATDASRIATDLLALASRPSV